MGNTFQTKANSALGTMGHIFQESLISWIRNTISHTQGGKDF